MTALGYHISKKVIVSDDIPALKEEMIYMADILGCHLILTTGGTGFSKRDNTPEATKQVIERVPWHRRSDAMD